MRVCIGGGGLAGLSLAYFLRGLNDVILLEANSKIGGLLKSETTNTFTFDIGGAHIIFSRDKDILNFIIDIIGRVVKHRRDARIYYNGKFIKYPFENGIYMLNPKERFEILLDFVNNLVRREKGELKKPENLEEWFYYVFGKAISRKYLVPYNIKIWKKPLRNISTEWINDRIPNPPVTDILKGVVGIPTEGYLHQLEFYYPKSGGIETLARSLLKNILGKVTIETGMKITSIKMGRGEITVKTGSRSIKCNIFINTIPLPELIKAIDNTPEYMLKLTRKLKYNSLIVVGVGLKNSFKPYHWIYFPQRKVTFHRVAAISNFTPQPVGYSSIIFETSTPPNSKLWKLNDKEITEKILGEAEELELLKRENVEVVKTWKWRYAYIIYDNEHSKVVSEVLNYLNEIGLYTTGRFGLWKYLNMDQVIMESKKLTLKILK
ncbi:MAG: FAD-dependent oxidoreductase [Candidatus Methanomethylicia archaeon]